MPRTTHVRTPGVKPPKQTAARSKNRLLAVERERKVMELRKAGATWEQIAEQTGYSSASTAARAFRKALDRVIFESHGDHKALQIERLNHMLVRLWPNVNAGDERAIETSLRVMDRLDALMGTAEAAKVDVTHQHTHEGAVLVIKGNEDEYVQRMEQMAKQAGAIDVPVGASRPGQGALEAPQTPALPDPGTNGHSNGNGHARIDLDATVDVLDTTVGDIVGDGPVNEPPCPRYVHSADPIRAESGLCARCPHTKDDH